MISVTRASQLRPVVHDNQRQYFWMLIKQYIIRKFNTPLYDFSGDKLQHNDRVFDLDYKFYGRKICDKGNYGTLLIDNDPDTIIGYKIQWHNGELTKCIDPARLVKWNPETVKVKL